VSNGHFTPQIGSDQALLRYLAVQPMQQSLYFGAAIFMLQCKKNNL